MERAGARWAVVLDDAENLHGWLSAERATGAGTVGSAGTPHGGVGAGRRVAEDGVRHDAAARGGLGGGARRRPLPRRPDAGVPARRPAPLGGGRPRSPARLARLPAQDQPECSLSGARRSGTDDDRVPSGSWSPILGRDAAGRLERECRRHQAGGAGDPDHRGDRVAPRGLQPADGGATCASTPAHTPGEPAPDPGAGLGQHRQARHQHRLERPHGPGRRAWPPSSARARGPPGPPRAAPGRSAPPAPRRRRAPPAGRAATSPATAARRRRCGRAATRPRPARARGRRGHAGGRDSMAGGPSA